MAGKKNNKLRIPMKFDDAVTGILGVSALKKKPCRHSLRGKGSKRAVRKRQT